MCTPLTLIRHRDNDRHQLIGWVRTQVYLAAAAASDPREKCDLSIYFVDINRIALEALASASFEFRRASNPEVFTTDTTCRRLRNLKRTPLIEFWVPHACDVRQTVVLDGPDVAYTQ